MIAGVADTHAALWLLFGDPRLSAAAKDGERRFAVLADIIQRQVKETLR
ncbi:MAG: hypothetical protein LAP87_02525 [Acidobacteriia bacterium]|nr:hypothetical protein [Terriglobia bacterium]